MILCIGTTPTLQRTMVFDELRIDEVNRAKEVREYASGKSINVARVLTTCGEAALAVGVYGGKRGELLIEDLVDAAIRHDLAPVKSQTRLCTTVIDDSTGQVTELVEESEAISQDELAVLERVIARHIAAAQAVVFSGTLAPGVPVDFCAKHINGSQPVIVDAKGEPMRLAMKRSGCIAKVNREELSQTTGSPIVTDDELADAMRRHLPPGGMMLVTMGKDGAMACSGDEVYRVRIPKVVVVSPIGSGDAVAAGLAAGIVRQWPIEQTLAFAMACGVANALTSDSGHLSRADVERLTQEILIEPIH